MKNLRIGVKLSAVMGVLLIALIALGLLGINRMSVINDQSSIIADNWLPSVSTLGKVNLATAYVRLSHARLVMSQAPEDQQNTVKELADREKVVADLLTTYEGLISSDEEKQLYTDFHQKWEAYVTQGKSAIEMALAGKTAEAIGWYNGDSKAAFIAVSGALGKLVDLNAKGAADASAEADAIYASSRLLVILTLLVASIFGIIMAFMLVRGISRPATAIAGVLQTMSTGNLDIQVPETDRGDEMGDIAKASLVFQEGMIKARKLDQEAKQEAERQAERGRQMEQAVSAFETVITEVVAVVSSAATELQATAQTLSATAEETAQQSTAVAAATEEMSQNVQTVASATEELSASISEISGQVTESTRIVGDAVAQANDTNAKVKSLSEAAQKIGEVVNLINDIAGQTNLLALNATIEAARAGEAGKGFAVVASEVKTLATQTSRATDEIAAQIRSIQDATDQSATAIATITQTIGRVNEISTGIASAVEEQGAATQEISRNVQQAAAGSAEVSSNIVGVTQASQQTSAGSTQVLSAASELANNGERLKREVDTFLHKVRSL